jgi:hypothetical protein
MVARSDAESECYNHRLRHGKINRVAVELHPGLPQSVLNFHLYYNQTRTHLSLDKDAPLRRAVQRCGTIVATPILSGLHHQYVRI